MVPGSGDFDEFIASNAAMAVCGLVRHYVGLICKDEDLVHVCFGLLMWDDGYKGGSDYDGAPHIWLEIAGKVRFAL